MVKKIANLKFLKNCRDSKIIPKFAIIKHALKDRNRRIFEDTSAAIIRSEIRQSRGTINVISEALYRLHLDLANSLRPDIWAKVEAASTERMQRLATSIEIKHKRKLAKLRNVQKPEHKPNDGKKS